MRRKNFILNIILFLFINILSFSNEKLPNVNTSINSMNPTYDESLKEYKIKSENTDSFYNYIKKMISEKGTATVYTKLENGNLIATDENNNVIFIEKLPENISEKTTYFESKQVYQLKNRKMLVNTNYILDSDGEKTKILSETLLKKNITGKNIFGIIDLMGDLSISLEKTFANVETYKSDIYDENDELIFSATYKNRKLEAESEVDGTFMKMTYMFEDNNFNKGTVNLYIDHKLFATVKVKDSLQDGEMKIFYPNGKVMGTSIFKNGKLNGVSKMYYENGKIMTKMNFKDDELEGEAIIYDEDGKILDKQFYKNGEEIK
ncbi:toxin-antitoxin system YwqK family antitoxin [Fusobacterium polymorphum]|uniref:toxin-antitoxin system YwqK family antitoxin n=1 Tax=Fusobacterium nucleatum subsp. polymorphum TaxID=76857 RepID=UPI001C6EFDDF|nr:toxin-antitoxin system YwqK family antitoxin [Fusobacterium polymorphum]QYR60535.1 toxin-antitoxin system YwqK family antitoxin [Fusobacterium polymorphum]WRL78148.1 toxin-antitoxin system YwqK family antitoxin [Fusobacterium polymorphum]